MMIQHHDPTFISGRIRNGSSSELKLNEEQMFTCHVFTLYKNYQGKEYELCCTLYNNRGVTEIGALGPS
jgi:hypothetical protein